MFENNSLAEGLNKQVSQGTNEAEVQQKRRYRSKREDSRGRRSRRSREASEPEEEVEKTF